MALEVESVPIPVSALIPSSVSVDLVYMAPVPNFDQGLYEGVHYGQYRLAPGVSKSGLDLIHLSPAYFKNNEIQVSRDTPETAFGRFSHSVILEPETVDKLYFRAPDCNRGTKQWALAEDQARGREMIKGSNWDAALRMRDSVLAHRSAGALFQDGASEVSAFGNDPETGVLLKCRPDYLRKDSGCIVDLKTSRSASPTYFSQSIARYRYHVQAAFYMDVLNFIWEREQIEFFFFVVVEKEPPYLVSCYELTGKALELGRSTYRKDLNKLLECHKTNHWPGYSDNDMIELIDLPPWTYLNGH